MDDGYDIVNSSDSFIPPSLDSGEDEEILQKVEENIKQLMQAAENTFTGNKEPDFKNRSMGNDA